MKIVKYIILILVIFVISLLVLSRVPAIQDRVVTNVIKNVLSNPVSLPDDGLSALVCGSRSEEHTSELSHANISYAVFCLKKKKNKKNKK